MRARMDWAKSCYGLHFKIKNSAFKNQPGLIFNQMAEFCTPTAFRQFVDTCQHFCQAYGRYKKCLWLLRIEPCHHGGVGCWLERLRNDIGIKNDHSKLTVLTGVLSR